MTLIPLDPVDLDATRPPDLDDCGTCNGDGEVCLTGRGTPDEVWELCRVCGGTGSRQP